MEIFARKAGLAPLSNIYVTTKNHEILTLASNLILLFASGSVYVKSVVEQGGDALIKQLVMMDT